MGDYALLLRNYTFRIPLQSAATSGGCRPAD
jgi:hypothetical protein